MKDFDTKVDNVSSYTAAEFNSAMGELENAITQTGISLAEGDSTQMGKTIANYASHGDFYTDSGAADAYLLNRIGNKRAITEYGNGARCRFKVGNTNTGASTINVNSLGVKNIKNSLGDDPSAGELALDDIVEIVFDSGNNYFVIVNSFRFSKLRKFNNMVENLGISSSVAASALTINIIQSDGSALDTLNPVRVAFRNATISTGQFDILDIVSALTITVPDTATLGHFNNDEGRIYVYLLNNAGASEIALSKTKFDDSRVVSTTILNTSSDDEYAIYSTTARSNVPIRCVGYLLISEATAGTWILNAIEISVQQISATPKQYYAEADSDSGMTLTNSVNTTINYEDVLEDSENIITIGSSWKMDIPWQSYLVLCATFTTNDTTWDVGEQFDIMIERNGSILKENGFEFFATTVQATLHTKQINAVVKVNEGDVVRILGFQNFGANMPLLTTSKWNRITVLGI